MKASLIARRTILRFVLALFLLAGTVAAALLSTASVAAPGHTGQALALRAALHPQAAFQALAQLRAASAASGRYRMPRNAPQYLPRPMIGGAASSPTIAEGVQTFDVFQATPNFQPNDGPLTPTNLTPVFTSDDNFLVFSSNRAHVDPTGNIVRDGTFHLWAVSARGDTVAGLNSLHQITTSAGSEFFPALSRDSSELAFTSTALGTAAGAGAQVGTTTNLYAIRNFSPTATGVDVANLTSLTIRPDNVNTGFGEVDRPTWDPAGQRLAFAARDTNGAFVGKRHIWFVYANSGGAISNPSSSSPVNFTPNNPPGKLTTGPGDDTDPAWTGAGADFIAFASTASGISTNTQAPAVTTAPAATPIRSIFLISGGGTGGTQITSGGGDDFGPAWDYNAAFAGLLAFSRAATGQALHGIDYVQAFTNNGVIALTPAGAFATSFNTNDPGGQIAKQFDDMYPSWTNVQAATSVAYASNRSVTYNDPATLKPLESPVSLPRAALAAGAPATGKVGPGYSGLLVSLLDDVDPPTLLPYSNGEVVHVTDGTTGNPNPLVPRRNGDILPGHAVTFTVRLSNREAGIDDNNVYIQIKDPDSKYQDAQSLEHKVFTKDSLDYITTPDSYADPNNPIGFDANNNAIFVGSATQYLYNGAAQSVDGDPNNLENIFGAFIPPGSATQKFTVGAGSVFAELRGPIAGMDGGAPLTVGQFDYSNVHNVTVGPVTFKQLVDQNPFTDVPVAAGPRRPLPGGNPADMKTFGQEYECQFLDPQFGAAGYNGGVAAGDTDPATPGKFYGTPFYLAGVDDQAAHGGFTHTPRPVANTGTTAPAEWLKLTRLPASQQDANGGVLYANSVPFATDAASAPFTTPLSASDFFLDVIAYDLANPADLPSTPADTSTGTVSFGSNFRIYDNVWGFTTQPFNGGNNILVVSDNALGQKFVGSTAFSNIPPIYYGAESYYTDVDVNRLPTAVYRGVQVGGKMPQKSGTNILPDTDPLPQLMPLQATSEGNIRQTTDADGDPFQQTLPVLNGLGVASYPDGALGQTTVDGVTVAASQQYSLWRILSRGALDPGVLASYQSTLTTQPAVNDPLTGFAVPAGSVADAPRCVIWVSPYTGNLPLNVTGSLQDTQTQQNLRSYVAAGGRLFISGGHIASALALGGSVPSLNGPGSFLYDVLNASLNAAAGGSSQALGAGGGVGSRISGDAFFNPNAAIGQVQNFITTITATNDTYATPNSLPLLLGNNYELIGPGNPPPYFNLWRTDGSLDQLGPVQVAFGSNSAVGQTDIITPQNGATTDVSINGPGFAVNTGGTGPALIYKDGIGAPGSRVVFSSFGLEGIGIEYYKVTINTQDFYFPRNQRPNILHNVVTYLRTGTVTGRITSGSSGGQAIQGATVYLVPNGGVLPASGRATFSGTTDSGGNYTIRGVEPGGYVAAAYRTGFTRTIANTPQSVSVGSPAVFNLNLIPVPPGGISGKVVDGANKPIAGASLTFTSTDGQATVTATSGTDGTYSITNVPTASYNSVVSAPGFTTSTTPTAPTANPFAVGTGQVTTGVNFTLAVVPGTLGGLVTDDFTHQPVAGAKITVKDATGVQVPGSPFTTTAPATTLAVGTVGAGQSVNYSVATLPQGTYTVSIAPPANFSNPVPVPPVTVTITTNQFTRQDFTLTSTLGTLAGTVTDGTTGAPIAGATVTVTDAAGTVAATFTTLADGTYTGQVPQGASYTATVSAPGFVTAPTNPASFTILAHQTTTANAQLLSASGTLGGLVTNSATGQPLGGATVTISNAAGTAVATLPTTAATTTSPADAGGATHPINFGPVTLPAVDAGGNPISYTVTVSDQGASTDATRPDFLTVGPFSITLTPRVFNYKPVALTTAYGNIGGLVADSLTPTVPLAGATVTIADSNGAVAATLISRVAATAAPDGSGPINYITTTPLYQGTYIVTVTATNHTAVTQTVTVVGGAFARADFAMAFPLVSTQGTLGGLVLDATTGGPVGGATLKVTDSKGNVVATFTSSATATVSPAVVTGDGGKVNYGGLLTAGTYTLSLTKSGFTVGGTQTVTIAPNSFSRKDFSGATFGLTPIHVFQAGYNFFSVPYDYGSAGVGFDTLFGTLNTGTTAAPSAGSNRSHVFVWSPTLLQYVLDPQAPADGLHLGQGYWVFLLGSHEVTVTGPRPTTATIPFALHQGWNQIGVPSLGAIGVSGLTFTNPATGVALSFSDASGSTFALIYATMYGYNGSAYVPLTAGGAMQPWQSYWIYAFHDVTVNIPTS